MAKAPSVGIGASQFQRTNAQLARNVERAVAAEFPLESRDGSIRVEATNIRVEDDKFDPGRLQVHQKAREEGGTVAVPIRADLQLFRGGKRVQRLRNFQLGELPMMSRLGSFMVGGNDYYTPTQLQLKPGIYTREMQNGAFESFINVQGRPLRIQMDPAQGVLKLFYGSTSVNLLAVLKALGYRTEDVAKAWGSSELVNRNTVKSVESEIKKLYRIVFEKKQNRNLVRAGVVNVESNVNDLSHAERVTALKQWFNEQKLDEFVTRKTLGTPSPTLSPDTLLRTSRKLLDVYRGRAEEDFRDAPEFKRARTVDDMMPEGLGRRIRLQKWKVLQKLAKPGTTIARGFGKNWLNVGTVQYFGGSDTTDPGLASTSEAANPLAILSQHSTAVLTGEGGIGSTRAITEAARLFHPTAVGFVDPYHTPEGSQIGVSTHLAANVRKVGSSLVTRMVKVDKGKIGKKVDVTQEEASDSVIGYPEYWDISKGKLRRFTRGVGGRKLVKANKDGKVQMVDYREVNYVLPSGAAMFDHTSLAAGFLSHTHPNRGMMAGKHLTQALPLANRELPLSDIRSASGKSSPLEDFAEPFLVRADVDGKVVEVKKDRIVVVDDSGKRHTYEIFDRYPMQAKVALDHLPKVKVGDRVKKGQLLADTNYTKDGKFALGTNVRTAYTPWKNASNFEDAIVISESAAKKFSSEHVHRLHLDLEDGLKHDKQLTYAQFPTIFKPGSFDKLGNDGIIKQGATVNPGDVVIAAVQKKDYDRHDRSSKNLSSIHKMLQRPWRDVSVVWDEIYPAEVVRVVRTKERVDVHLRTVEPAQVGDKLSMGSAAKGTISQIVADDKMPKDKKGRHIEAILNPHGVAGRINPSQTIEQAVGKLVRDHGVKFDHSHFSGEDYAAEARKMLEERGDSHTEKLYDPETGKWTEEPVATGYNYMYKLDHPVRKKFSAREREGYTLDETPIKGKGRGGQSYDPLTTYALLGHNAHAILGESVGVRGAKNDDFWHAYQAGETPPPPKTPFVFEKFRSMLNVAGVDTKQHGDIMHFLPMTDEAVRERSNGVIREATQLKVRGTKALDIVEEKGGLFDPKTTGGLKGENWTHIELNEKIPHPLYDKVIRDITQMKEADFYGLVGHTRWWNPDTGKIQTTPGGGALTGNEAFEKMLDFDPKKKLQEVKQRLRTAVGSEKNKLHRASRYLRGLIKTGMQPNKAYMTSVVPVLPPKFRPVVEMKGGALRVADSNMLYRDIVLTQDALQEAEKAGLPPEELRKARLDVYKSVGALIGVNNPLTHRDDRDDAKGMIDAIKGKHNKQGLFQGMLARRRNDYTGRSTIEPDANLGIDEAGIPEEMAWKIYKPTVVRRLSQLGWKPGDAMKQVEQRTEAARQALDVELKERPVILNRAPSLHKGSVAALRPTLVPGKEVKISPAVIGPFNADFDGDTMSVTAPITDEAKEEARELLPSKNPFYERSRTMGYDLGKDIITGLFALTSKGLNTGLKFKDPKEAIELYKSGRRGLKMNSMVRIEGMRMPQSIGWLIFMDMVPERYRKRIVPPITGKKLEAILTEIAEKDPASLNRMTRRLAAAGFNAAAARGGITTSVNELSMDRSKVIRLIDQLESEVEKVKSKKLGKDDQNKELAKVHDRYADEIRNEIKDHLDEVGEAGRIFLEAKPSGKLNVDQFRQILASQLMVRDVKGDVVPAVVRTGFGQGVDPADVVLMSPGARAGLVGRSLATAKPGFLAKEIAGTMAPVRVFMKDCGTSKGIQVRLDENVKGADADVLDRHLLRNVPGIGRRNDPITPEMLSKMRDKNMKSVWVRSAMTCEAEKPPCQMCAGRDASGKLHPIGSNIGMSYGQSISEPSTQLIMRMFHSGGTLGAGDSLQAGFQRVQELLKDPAAIRNQGTLSDVNGVVSSKRNAPQGGFFVYVRDNKGKEIEHHVRQGRKVTVKPGDKVSVGDKLSDGNFRAGEIAAKKGNLAAQQYIVDEARKAYTDAGVVVRKPVLEVLAASSTRYIKITDDGDEEELAIGDILHENEYNRLRKKNPRIQGVPSMPGLSMKPVQTSEDLFERLSFQRLEGAIREVPALSGKANITGDDAPVTGFTFGAKFRPGQAAHKLNAQDLGYTLDSAFEKVAMYDD